MRTLRGFVLIVLFFLPLVLCTGHSDKQRIGDMLLQSMRAADATLQEAYVQGWTQLTPGVWTVEKLAGLALQSVAIIEDRPQNYHFEVIDQAEKKCVRIVSTVDEPAYTLTATSQNGTNAFLSVVIKGSPEHLPTFQQQIDKILQTAGGRPHISSCLVGWINGKLSNGEWASILLQTFSMLGATAVDEMHDAKIVSVTGYSPNLPGYLAIEGTRVNVNLASRYSPYDHRTYITLGTPTITREF